MANVAVILSDDLSSADRAAVSMAVRRFGAQATAFGGAAAQRYAAAAGIGAAPELPASFDLALVSERLGDLPAAEIAEARGAALVFEVLEVEAAKPQAAAGGAEWIVTRDLGHGERDMLTVKAPAVLVISGQAASDVYVSRYRRRQATATGVFAAWPDGLAAISSGWEPARQRTRTTGIAQKTGGSATDRALGHFGVADAVVAANGEAIISGDPQTCAEHLLRYLGHHGFIDRRTSSQAGAADRVPTTAQGGHPRTGGSTVGAGASQAFRGVVAALSARIARGPRPFDGPDPGMARRPRPLSAAVAMPGFLARRPRPVGDVLPRRMRGPYPINFQLN